jgi:hypothetical protein
LSEIGAQVTTSRSQRVFQVMPWTPVAGDAAFAPAAALLSLPFVDISLQRSLEAKS